MNDQSGMAFPIVPRASVAALAGSKIREVANASMDRRDVLAFWFGEPDEVTPEFIRSAARRALDAGDTFYTPNLGIAPLREAIAGYVSALHRPVDPARVVITGSGVAALMLTHQTLLSPRDRVVVVTPVWPNVAEAPKILGAEVVRIPLDCVDGAWLLDLDRLLAALTPTTRALVINSPSNPTGWVITREAQQAILARCRKLGIWMVADDVYERLVFSGERCAPSFLDIADEADLLISVNSFSKPWRMTGWRLGWLVSPRSRQGGMLTEHLAKLIEYNTSCAPGFVQRAGIVAVTDGEPVVEQFVQRLQAARDFLCERLARLPGVHLAKPGGAMYVFFSLDAAAGDTLNFCKRLVTEAGLGLAPGSAFGAEGEGSLRWCIASSTERLEAGVKRLVSFLEREYR